MRRYAPWVAVTALLLLGLLFRGTIVGNGSRAPEPHAVTGENHAGAFGGPELILHDVDMREIGEKGWTFRLRSEQASYAIAGKSLSARDVTVSLPEPEGEVTVRAPLASWQMGAGRIFLPEGASADGAGGWSAAVAAARIDLNERSFRADGAARMDGPGLAVVGDNLVWRWEAGQLSLEIPRSRIVPAALAGRKRG